MARAAALAMLMLPGCYGAHGVVGGDEPEPPPSDPPPDLPQDAGFVMPPVSSCGGHDRVTVIVDAVGARTCEPARYPGSALYAIEPSPGGLRLRIDTCPDADDDCRCDVTVTGLRAGVHAEIAAVMGPVTVQLAEGGVAIEQPIECEPGPEPVGCVSSLVFAAMDGLIASPPIDPDSLDVRLGDPVCSRSAPEVGEDCTATVHELVVTGWVSGFPGAIGTEQVVVEGEPVTLDGTLDIFHPIRTSAGSCPDARIAPTAAWAAWRPAHR